MGLTDIDLYWYMIINCRAAIWLHLSLCKSSYAACELRTKQTLTDGIHHAAQLRKKQQAQMGALLKS